MKRRKRKRKKRRRTETIDDDNPSMKGNQDIFVLLNIASFGLQSHVVFNKPFTSTVYFYYCTPDGAVWSREDLGAT
jgi:hypothetical protein